jgi:putative spermidine/putrescine transport system substrate-binding protein
MPRRLPIIAAAIALAATAVFAGPAAQAADAVRLTFFIWLGSNQGVVPKEVIAAYTKAHPNVTIDIIESNNTITYPKMVAARRTTPDQPLVHCGFFNVDSVTRGEIADDMWEPLNPARIPNMANVFPTYIPADKKAVGYQMSGIGILYNKNEMKTPPDSWTALWDPANKGRVVDFDYDTRLMFIAAKLNGGGVNDIDPGLKIWSEHADNFRALVDSNDALKNLLVSGDAWMGPWFSSLSQVWINEGAPLGFAVPKEGLIAFPIYLTIAKGVNDAQRAVCEDLINELLSPDNAGRYGALTGGIPVVANATLTDEQKNNPLLSLELAKDAILPDYSVIAKNTADWKDRWDREVKVKMR